MTAPDTNQASSRIYLAGEWVLIVGLMVTFAWTTLQLGGYLAETMVLSSWAIFGLAALGGCLLAVKPQKLNPAALIPLPFLAFALASVLWLAPAPWLAWREWLLWLQMWLVFVLVLHFGRRRAATATIVGTFVALGMIGVGMAAYQRFVNPAWMMMGKVQVEQFGDRSAGMFGIPNSLAGLLELMIPLCGAMMLSRRTNLMVKILCGWVGGLFLFALVLTGSRGGWIAVAGALVLWPLLGGKNWSRRLTGLFVVIVMVSAVSLALYKFSAPVRDRLQPFLAGEFESSRPIIWKVGVNIWQDYPWLGRGAASYNVVFDQYRPANFLNEPHWTHNDYLNSLSDYGAVGFFLWAGAGVALMGLGWRAVRQARRAGTPAEGLGQGWRWKFGLFLGLVAYGLHLFVDFHTKIPALAYAAAVVDALLLRHESAVATTRPWTVRALGIFGAAGALLVAVGIASPLYRSEALRYGARVAMDKHAATGEGELKVFVPRAIKNLERAAAIYPRNGQAWSDYAQAVMLSWHASGGDLFALGMVGERALDRAIALCPVNAEFWVRKGVAQDMQGRRAEAGKSFEHALALAPRSPTWWYCYADHLSVIPGERPRALAAVQTCLELDPSLSMAVALRQRLIDNR